jgi:DNA polymerase III epsilon subunit-like protein
MPDTHNPEHFDESQLHTSLADALVCYTIFDVMLQNEDTRQPVLDFLTKGTEQHI